jgi:SNF2 family DNA or RNA helicase
MLHEIGYDKSINKLYVRFPYDAGYIARVKEIPSAKWDSTQRTWFVEPVYFLAVINQFPGFSKDLELTTLYNEWLNAEKAAEISSRNKLIQLKSVGVQTKRVLFKHQIEGIYKILESRRIILADEMGLGKTTTALVAAREVGLPIYVVAPKSLHTNWIREAAINETPLARSPISWASIQKPPEGEYTLILDEAHAMQSMMSTRTKRALDLAHNARFVIAITGTPLKNGRPSNLFALLAAVKHKLALSKREYERVYCNAHATRFSKWDATGASNLDLLYLETKDIILRRDKETCLDLPNKLRTLRAAEITPEAEIVYENIFTMLRSRWRNRVKNNEILSTNEKLMMFMQLRHAASWAKLYESQKMAEELFSQNKQAVFFTAFTDSADALADLITNNASPCGQITGKISQQDRQTYIDDFQAGKLKFLVCTFGAGGVGITLTNASHVILHDRPWTPGDAMQAEDRLHRIGQQFTVNSYWVQCNTTDIKIDSLLLKKQGNISQILTGDRDELALDFDIREQVDRLLDEIFS